MRDLIVEEVRKRREEHAARFNYDADAIFEDYRKIQKERGWAVVSLPPLRPASRLQPVLPSSGELKTVP